MRSHYTSLVTDLYELTMAYGYWKSGLAERPAVFHLYYRSAPFKGRFVVAAGLEEASKFLDDYQFSEEELRYLGSLEDAEGSALFEGAFLDFLGTHPFRCDIAAMPEGTAVFPGEPFLRVTAPLFQAQIIESALLCILNFSSLAATKATRICAAAEGAPVVDFGLRRAQGIDGAMLAARSAYIGGCAGTSNTLAGMKYGIPVKGTQAHSWIMAFGSEKEAFQKYAEAMPGNCIFLVDTYDSVGGVRNAIAVGRELAGAGHSFAGIRLDSGDLTELSRRARALLDDSGFTETKIVASDELDEYRIRELKQAGARIDLWGVGTRLVTCFDDPALGGVYKLGALADEQENWSPRLKLSDEAEKASLPGILQVRRYARSDGRFLKDVIWSELEGEPEAASDAESLPEDLLLPVFRKGRRVRPAESLPVLRKRCRKQLESMDPELQFPESDDATYEVGIEPKLERARRDLQAQAGSREESRG